MAGEAWRGGGPGAQLQEGAAIADPANDDKSETIRHVVVR